MAYDPVSCEPRYLNVVGKSLLVISCGGQFPIVEDLSLRMLRSAKQIYDVYEPLSNETAAERGPVINLTFDTSAAQNRDRVFVMYDDNDLKVRHSHHHCHRPQHCNNNNNNNQDNVYGAVM